jgi:beta-glucosidase
VEAVGFGFNRQVVTGLLREELGFEGIVCTDWGLVTDAEVFGRPFPARAWGVEHLSRLGRVERILAAGADQLGGEACPDIVVQLVRDGRVPEERLDVSVARLLTEKFVLGLFDAGRSVDEDTAEAVVGAADLVAAGRRAQSRAVTVLTTEAVPLPLGAGRSRPLRLVLAALVEEDPAAPRLQPLTTADRAGLEVVDGTDHADVALVRLEAPYERRGPGFESFFHAGSLEFPDAVLDVVRDLAARVPTIAVVHLDRPAVLTPLVEAGVSLVVDFGASTEALLDALTGVVPAEGRLPFDLPRSTAAVTSSPSDAPFSTPDPLFRCGHGVPSRT